MNVDDRSWGNIATLLPTAQAVARQFLVKAQAAMQPHGIVVKIISGTRSYAEQEQLYAQGRSKPGPIVTQARGGYSNHNFGIAWDIGLFQNDRYLDESPYYRELGPVGESLGLEWGGRWRFEDDPHFQLQTGLTLAQMRDRVGRGETIV